jgi:2,4-dienoyl-CoA reductase-like NADH-dependent reductase (Old Yellow Enzyme family)
VYSQFFFLFDSYLLHNFLSGNSNHRTDQYGGSLENRLRYPLEIIAAMRQVWPAEKPFWVRLSSSDHKNVESFSKDENGWDIYQAIEYAKELKKIGVDVIDCSSGGNLTEIKVNPLLLPHDNQPCIYTYFFFLLE